ncbi:MAG: MFS transporter [Anaerovoracaceae bacterium]|jgi:OFA family oxalate/formate antiporter-like MFS transporter
MKKIRLNKWKNGAAPALLIHCSIGSVYCWSTFSEALAQKVGVSPGILGWAFSIAIFFLGMSAAFASRIVEQNVKRSSLISMIFFCTGFLGTGVISFLGGRIPAPIAALLIFFFYGAVMGVGLGTGYLTPVKTLMLWFRENKGLATGISIMGFGLAKAIASPFMILLQEKFGITAMFFILGAVYACTMYLGHKLIHKPLDWKESGTNQVSKLALFKDTFFLRTWICFYLNITCGLALISYERPILEFAGAGLALIGMIQVFTALANAGGRIGYASLSDLFSKKMRIYFVVFLTSMAACIIMELPIFPVLIGCIILLIVVNAGYGGGFSTLPTILEHHYGMESISTIHGVALSAWAFAGLTGNQITAACLRISEANGYRYMVAVIAVLYIVSMILSLTLIKKE